MNKIFTCILLLLFAVDAMPQRIVNRYGLDLVKNGEQYKLHDEALIRKLNLFDFDNLPVDMLLPYHWQPTYLSQKEFDNCTTTTHTYKKYSKYELKLQVDKANGTEATPFIIWIHGGGWEAGDYTGHERMSKYLASHGITGIRISYSLLPQGAKMKDAWSDIQDALKYVKEHAQEFNIDPDRFGFAGHSAGGHLSTYAAMRTPGTKLLVAVNGVYDLNKIQKGFEPTEHHFQFLGTNEKEREFASPVNYVHPKVPYSAFFYSSGDFLLDPGQIGLIAEKLKENNVGYELIQKDFYSHDGFIALTDLHESTLMKILILAKTHL